MKLIYHPLSPYSRKAYMTALELELASKITLQKVVVCPIPYPGWSDNNDDVVTAGNPLAKIPTLLIPSYSGDTDSCDTSLPGIAIFDSRAICEALRDMSGHPGSIDWRLRAQENTLISIADGILDAQILITYEERIRAERNLLFPEWVQGQTTKMRRGLDALERNYAGTQFLRLETGATMATNGEIAVAAMLGRMDLVTKDWNWREGRPKLAGWWDGWKTRESFVRTSADVDWKTGEKAGKHSNPSIKFEPQKEKLKI
jgi:glutathione S-transferase